MRSISESEIENLLNDPLQAKALFPDNVFYSASILSFQDLLVSGDCRITGIGELLQVGFKNVTFSALTISPAIHPDRDSIFKFDSCQFDEIRLDNAFKSSVNLINTVSLRNVGLDGSFRSFQVHQKLPLAIESVEMEVFGEEGDSFLARMNFVGPEIGELSIGKLRVIEGSVSLSLRKTVVNDLNCDFKSGSEVQISNGSSIETFHVTGQMKRLSIRDSRVGVLYAYQTSLDANVIILKSEIQGILFDSEASLNNISIAKGSTIGTISFDFGSAEGIYLSACQVDHLDVKVRDFAFDWLVISGQNGQTRVNQLTIRDGILEKGRNGEKATIRIQNLSVSILSFESITNLANIYISEITTHNINDFEIPKLGKFASSFSFPKIRDSDSSVLRLINSDLGKINFVSCDFSEMMLVTSGSKFNEVYLSGTEMPRYLVGDSRQRQIGYYQMKKLFDSLGDGIQSTRYQSLELKAHLETLENRKPKPIIFSDVWLELTTLRINYWSNRFGANWGRALMLVIASTTLFFIAYAHSLGYVFTWEWSKREYLKNFHEIAKFIFDFALPTHRADLVTSALGVEANVFSTFLDASARIVNGYLLYQLIQAFRRYGKNS